MCAQTMPAAETNRSSSSECWIVSWRGMTGGTLSTVAMRFTISLSENMTTTCAHTTVHAVRGHG